MAQVVWTEPAISDLEKIAEYIALDKVSAATALVKKVFSAVERLEQFPKSGRKPPELKKAIYREIIVGPCRIFYRQDQEIVYILFVMRVERKLRQHLLEARKIWKG